MNDRENDTMRENEGRQVQQELENQLRAFGDTVSDAFAHGFEGKGEDIGDRAYGVGRAAVNAANFGLGEAAKAFRSSREEYYRSRQNAQNTKKQGLNEDCINAQAAGVSGWFRQMFGKAETTPADEIRASAKKRYSAGCALLAVGITFTVIFGITAVSCLGAAGLFTPNAAVLQALLQDSFMAENAAAMGSFALGAVRITGWCFAAVTAVFVWMITAGASRLKASKTLLRLAEAAEGFDCKKGLPLEAVDEKKARALKRVRRFIRNGWLSAWVDEKAENCIVVASGANANLLPSDLAKAEEAIELADLILMQLEVPMETVCFVADIAWQKGKKVILNPAPAHPLPADLLHHLYLITPNETEAEMITGVKITDDISAVEAARVLSGMGVQHVIITLGSKGALICSDGKAEIVPALKVEAVDTTAAGDVFNGALTVALSEGRNLKESVRFACKASAISVTRVGAQSSAPYRNEVDIFD